MQPQKTKKNAQPKHDYRHLSFKSWFNKLNFPNTIHWFPEMAKTHVSLILH